MNSGCMAVSSVWLCRGPAQAAQVKGGRILRGEPDAVLENRILSLPLLQHSCSMLVQMLKANFQCVLVPHFLPLTPSPHLSKGKNVNCPNQRHVVKTD